MNSKEIPNLQTINTFFVAIRLGNINEVNRLVNNDLLDIIHPIMNIRPIDEAIRYRQISILKCLLWLGVDSKLQNPMTLLTPLELARNVGDPETISLLRCHIHNSSNRSGKNSRQEDGNNLPRFRAKRQRIGESLGDIQATAHLSLSTSAESTTLQPSPAQADLTQQASPDTSIPKTHKPSTIDAIVDLHIQVRALSEEVKKLQQDIRNDIQQVNELKSEIGTLRASLQMQQENQMYQCSQMDMTSFLSWETHIESDWPVSPSSPTHSFFNEIANYPNNSDEDFDIPISSYSNSM